MNNSDGSRNVPMIEGDLIPICCVTFYSCQICYYLLLNIWLCRASISVTKNYCSIYGRNTLIRSCQHILQDVTIH